MAKNIIAEVRVHFLFLAITNESNTWEIDHRRKQHSRRVRMSTFDLVHWGNSRVRLRLEFLRIVIITLMLSQSNHRRHPLQPRNILSVFRLCDLASLHQAPVLAAVYGRCRI